MYFTDFTSNVRAWTLSNGRQSIQPMPYCMKLVQRNENEFVAAHYVWFVFLVFSYNAAHDVSGKINKYQYQQQNTQHTCALNDRHFFSFNKNNTRSYSNSYTNYNYDPLEQRLGVSVPFHFEWICTRTRHLARPQRIDTFTHTHTHSGIQRMCCVRVSSVQVYLRIVFFIFIYQQYL